MIERKITYRISISILLIFFGSMMSIGQDDLSIQLTPLSGVHSIQSHLNYIEDNLESTSLSYASSRFNGDENLQIKQFSLSIRSYLKQVFSDYNITLIEKNSKILIIVQGEKEVNYIRIYGYIRDQSDGEVLAGASIFDKISKNRTLSNHAGYYNLTVRDGNASLSVEYLGYTPKIIDLEEKGDRQYDIDLNFENELSTVIISSQMPTASDYWEGGEKIDVNTLEHHGSLNGDDDLFEDIRRKVGAQSGNEGQGGFYVRGGTTDQNLILLDGVAMYEVSHTAGISSIFIDESIREAILVKNGFSSEYGGRMSSVLDINLKDGHDKEVKGSFNLGLFGGKIHLEGPLQKGKTSFNFSAKTSWINVFLDQLIKEEVQYDDIDVNYGDVTMKLTHRFSPTSRISYSLYKGRDNIELEKREEFFDTSTNPLVDNFRFKENNTLNWGSTVHAINFDQVFGDKLFWQIHLGSVSYNYNSSSFYEFVSQDAGVPDSRILDLRTQSGIEDLSFSSNIEYYLHGDHRLKFGLNYINHTYNPTLRQSDIRIQGETSRDSTSSRTYTGHEFGFFVDDNILIKPWWRINTGLRLATFGVDETLYFNLEPRVLSKFHVSDKITLEFSFSRMTQNVHLLVNPGIGLPSDLWVPSTNNLAPEISDQISIGADIQLPFGLKGYTSAYYKKLQNVLDYSASEDLFFTILNDDKITPIDLQTRGWEERVSSGNGYSKGLEFSLERSEGILRGWAAYSLSKTTRQFDDINGGEVYPYRFDRRHDINLGASLIVNKSFDLSAKWVYGSGYAITLALEEIPTPFEENILVPNGRNNLRLSPFHHLDLQFNYHLVSEHSKFDVSFGIYNVYNRLNQYYIYLFNNRLTGESSFRQVSLFPILPSLTVEYTF